jgi:RimJ/RimL family protein N-acetyltransferase
MLSTERLVLREWRAADRTPFAAMNADPRVMEHFPATQTRAESDAFADRIAAHFDEHGYGLWAVEPRDGSAGFLGFVGLQHVSFAAPFAPAVEIGWRLAYDAWGRGYATEAARAALGYAFGEAALDEVVSFTTVANERSQAVMRKIGLRRDPAGDFDHPRVDDPRIRPHVLYRIRRRP